LKHGSRPFDVLFGKRLNSLEDYKKTPTTMINTLAIKAKTKNIKKIVFSTIRTKTKKDAKRKCKDKNKERERNKRFKVGEWVMKKKNGLAKGVQTL
jgi:hypothetical protein